MTCYLGRLNLQLPALSWKVSHGRSPMEDHSEIIRRVEERRREQQYSKAKFSQLTQTITNEEGLVPTREILPEQPGTWRLLRDRKVLIHPDHRCSRVSKYIQYNPICGIIHHLGSNQDSRRAVEAPSFTACHSKQPCVNQCDPA